MVDGVLKVDVQLNEGFGRVGGVHAADEIVHKKVNEPFAFMLRGRWGDPLGRVMGGGVGRGVVGRVVNTALVAVSCGDHGGGSKRSRRYQREGVKEKKIRVNSIECRSRRCRRKGRRLDQNKI